MPLGLALVIAAEETRPTVAAAAFAGSVVLMLSFSALYHRITWSHRQRLWFRRLDHAGIYGLIAGTYTPFGLLVLDGTWQTVVLAVVWTGAALAILQKLAWPEAPKWIAVVLAVGLGWIGALVFPQLLANAGVTATLLVLAGGLVYTAGALVYAFERPNPAPATFGYHEIFHLLVVAAVGLQAAAVALVVL